MSAIGSERGIEAGWADQGGRQPQEVLVAGGGWRSVLWQSGLTQAGEKGVLDQLADLRHAEISHSDQPSNARITAAAAQASRLREFSSGALDLAVEGTSRGEPGANTRQYRIGIACLFQPDDRLFRSLLQQSHTGDAEIPIRNRVIVRMHADGLLGKRDRLLYRTGPELALGERSV